jgi:thioredoxin-like negative regulator of GroEL
VAFAAVQVRHSAMVRMLRRELAEVRASGTRREGLPVGTVAPEFDLPGIDGTTGTLAGLVQGGHPVVLVFLHPECGPCQDLVQELPRWREHLNGSLTLVPVSSGDLAANIEWARTCDLTQMLVQDGSEVAAQYRLRGTPTAVLIDTGGRIAAPPARGPSEIRELLTHLAPAPALP